MRKIDRYTIFLLIAAALLNGCEVMPPQPDSGARYPSSADYAYEEVRRCRADNLRAHTELTADYERATRTEQIHRREGQQFDALKARVKSLRAPLARDGLTLRECQAIGGALARERDELARFTRHEPPLQRCMADNRTAHQDTLALYENAKRAGKIDPGEAQRFNAMEGRLHNLRADLARDGITLRDCERIAGAIARERDEVNRMTRTDSATVRCVTENWRAHDAVYETYNEAARTGKISAGDAQQFRHIDERLKKFLPVLKRGSASLEECQRLSRAIARERTLVDAMIPR